METLGWEGEAVNPDWLWSCCALVLNELMILTLCEIVVLAPEMQKVKVQFCGKITGLKRKQTTDDLFTMLCTDDSEVVLDLLPAPCEENHRNKL